MADEPDQGSTEHVETPAGTEVDSPVPAPDSDDAGSDGEDASSE